MYQRIIDTGCNLGASVTHCDHWVVINFLLCAKSDSQAKKRDLYIYMFVTIIFLKFPY